MHCEPNRIKMKKTQDADQRARIGKAEKETMEEQKDKITIRRAVSDDAYLTKNSMQFHEHMGYRLVGSFTKCGYKFGRWYDMVWMEKHISEHVSEQPPMIPFAECVFLTDE